jgi:serine/threonine protein kinase/Tol biopolymer transport system component
VIGETISHYRILDQIGSGGMGVVYKAEDLRLKRLVALKFLSGEYALHTNALERFRWEAQAASALNHPNICTVHDIGEVDGQPFIVMELLDGQSLKDVLVQGKLAPERVVAIGIQIADALDVAHVRDIIHRDLKPANIFLTGRDHAKLLDFGLAKTSPGSLADAAGVAETGTVLYLTSPGTTVGTAAYMSPEQVRGEPVDGRTDIFALGAVLYELVTGVPAFRGRTAGVIQEAILNRTPASPGSLTPNVPAKLEEVIARCLEKDPDLRYQTAGDLRADLKRVLRDGTSASMSVTAMPTIAPTARPKEWLTRRPMTVLLGTMAVLVTAALVWIALGSQRRDVEPPSRLMPFTTLPGLLRQPAFSPQGNQIAFSWDGGHGESFSIYTQLVDAGRWLRLTNVVGEDSSPAWSPDGRYIAFLRHSADGDAYYAVPALGGAEKRVASSYGVPFSYGPSIAWSPDGRVLAVIDRTRANEALNILLITMKGPREVRRLLSRPMPYLQNPAFSGDGMLLAFVAGSGFLAQDVYVTDLTGGEPRRLTNDGRHIAGLTWSADDRNVLFSSNRSGLFGVWKVPASGGEPQIMPAVAEDSYAPTVSRQTGSLAFLRQRIDWNIWQVAGPRAADTGSPPARLIYSTREEWQPTFSPDDERIAFVSTRSGSQEIWVSDRSGGNLTQVTSFRGPPTGTPRWAPDGRRLVLDSRLGGDSDIFIATSDGSSVTPLTQGPSEDVVPSWSRDGKWIYFTSDRAGREQIWKIASGGGTPVLVIDTPGRDATESDDGTYLYYWSRGTIWRRPLGGGPEAAVVAHSKWGSWVLRQEGIYLLNEDARPRPSIDCFEFATGRRTVLRSLDDWPHLRFPSSFDLSHDAGTFLFGRVDQVQDDIMVIDFK